MARSTAAIGHANSVLPAGLMEACIARWRRQGEPAFTEPTNCEFAKGVKTAPRSISELGAPASQTNKYKESGKIPPMKDAG
jgi:hypothetical protein